MQIHMSLPVRSDAYVGVGRSGRDADPHVLARLITEDCCILPRRTLALPSVIGVGYDARCVSRWNAVAPIDLGVGVRGEIIHKPDCPETIDQALYQSREVGGHRVAC